MPLIEQMFDGDKVDWYYNKYNDICIRQKTCEVEPLVFVITAKTRAGYEKACNTLKSAPKMYELMDFIASYIESATKSYKAFPSELLSYAEKIREIQKEISGNSKYDKKQENNFSRKWRLFPWRKKKDDNKESN